MYERYPNIYAAARRNAGLTQERAAELLDLSVESIKAYESGGRLPPGEAVCRMADVYDSPGLRLEHARETDALGVIPKAARPRAFPMAVLSLVDRLADFSERRRERQLLRIAANGAIDEDEQPLYDEIAGELEDIGAAVLSLICCDGAKKERREGATSQRTGGNKLGKTLIHTPILQPPCRSVKGNLRRKGGDGA